MRKIISALCIVCIMVMLLNCCANNSMNDEAQSSSTSASVTDAPKTNGVTAEATEKEKTTQAESVIKTETITIKNEKYSFTIQKTDFEKNYSEEILMNISRLVPMGFGLDDYDNWNGTPNEVINDVLRCVQVSRNNWFFERYDNDSPEYTAAQNEMSKNPFEPSDVDCFVITDIEKINKFLSERFGSEARQFKSEDFETYNEVKVSDEPIALGYLYPTYRYVYLPESEMVACFVEYFTGSEGPAAYIYDIQTVDGSYIVKAVSGSYNYGENGDTFAGMQSDALKNFGQYTEDSLDNYTMTLAYDNNGNLYTKSVKKTQILPDNY